MVSLQAFTSFPNLITTYDIQDYRSINNNKIAPKNTLLSLLFDNGFSYYASLVDTAGLNGFFADEQAMFTLFVVKDDDIPERLKRIIINADKNTALSIINYSTIQKPINQRSLKSSTCYYIDTRYNKDRLFITNYNGQTLINNSKVIDCMVLDNGMVYVVDKLLIPSFV
jgi:hypothetical protein